MKNLFPPLLLLFLLVATVAGQADDPMNNWHQWRGPVGTGVAPQSQPPLNWSETQNVKWKISVDGRGSSTPIIWGEKVFLLTAIDTGLKDSSIPDPADQPKSNFFDIKRPNTQHDFVVICLNRKTGKEIWRRIATRKIPHEGVHNDNDYASASPVTDGKLLYCWFGSAGLFCYDLSGTLKWKRDLGEVPVESSLGEGCSPVLHRNRLVIVRDHAGQSTISVLDATTGKLVWSKKRDEKTAWATPLVVEHKGVSQVVTAASKWIRSYDLADGKLIWQCSGLTGNVIPCPVLVGEHVICMSGYQGYSAMSISLDSEGDVSNSNQIRWSRSRGTPYIPSSLLYDELLFINQSNQPILTCLDSKNGDVVFGPKRLSGVSNIYASPVGANGRVYYTGRNGTTVVLEHSDRFRVLATNRLDERIDASPALAGSQLFLRGRNSLYCLENDPE